MITFLPKKKVGIASIYGKNEIQRIELNKFQYSVNASIDFTHRSESLYMLHSVQNQIKSGT